jgi:leucyl-tRNA---protein transferase
VPPAFRLLPTYEHECHYLSGLEAATAHFLVRRCDDATLEELLARGIRHFGAWFFYPVCPACVRCIPIRIPVGSYRFTRSNRRLIRDHADLQVTFAREEANDESHALYRLHKRRFDEPGGEEDFASYRKTFYAEAPYRRTLSFRSGGVLVGRMHLDCTAKAFSAVYSYYDDRLRGRSIGTYAVLKSIELARSAGADHLYLGFYIAENRSMRYKLKFYPSEILTESGWVPARNARGEIVAARELERTIPCIREGDAPEENTAVIDAVEPEPLDEESPYTKSPTDSAASPVRE